MYLSSTVRRYGLVALMVVSALLAGSSCDDDPVGPGAGEEAPFYYMDMGRVPPRLYALYPSSGRIDSSDVSWSAQEGITVAANGDRLYLAERSYITVIDTDSLQLVATLPYAPDNAIGVSPDGALIAIANGDGLTVLRTEDYGVEFSDTLSVWNCEFSSDSKSVYCGCRGTEGVYYVDLTDTTRAGECLDVGEGASYMSCRRRTSRSSCCTKLSGHISGRSKSMMSLLIR